MASRGKRYELTKGLVEGTPLPLPGRSLFLWDEKIRGFGIRIMASGAHVFYVDYRTRDAKRERRRMPIGKYGVLTCAEAREIARRTLAGVEWGKDPLGERRARRSAMTVADLCDKYLEDWEKGLVLGKGGRPKKASNLAADRGRIARHIKPLLGKHIVAELKRSDLAAFQMDVAAGKTRADIKTGKKRGRAIVEGGPGTAKRTLGLLGGILSHARDLDIIEDSPARGIRRAPDGVRDRRLSPDEYRAFGVALGAAEGDSEAWQAIAGVRLLALTGCRLGEIQALRWNEVDPTASCLRLEDSKTGKNTRPIGQAVLDVLGSLPHVEGQTYVLPGLRGAGHIANLAAVVKRLADEAKLEGVTPHVLRHSFASTAGDMGMSIPTIGALLGHASGGVTSRYIHQLDSILVAAADKVSSEVQALLAGQHGNVRAFAGARHRSG